MKLIIIQCVSLILFIAIVVHLSPYINRRLNRRPFEIPVTIVINLILLPILYTQMNRPAVLPILAT
jgi:hypothetical protein